MVTVPPVMMMPVIGMSMIGMPVRIERMAFLRLRPVMMGLSVVRVIGVMMVSLTGMGHAGGTVQF